MRPGPLVNDAFTESEHGQASSLEADKQTAKGKAQTRSWLLGGGRSNSIDGTIRYIEQSFTSPEISPL